MKQANAFRVAVLRWIDRDGVARMIHNELGALGHQPAYLDHTAAIPGATEVIFSFGPYGKILPVLSRLDEIPSEHRPNVVHWNTEGVPDLRIPWPVMRALSSVRSWLGRLEGDAPNRNALHRWASAQMLRFRYVGDYYYAHRRGWIDLFGDSSAIYARLHTGHGMPAIFAPWGAMPGDYADLGLERDIDVLWMGRRATRRRSQRLDRIRRELNRHGVRMHVVDGAENPFVYGARRMRLLNRTKITLNLTRTWYDDNFSRLSMAAPNRSLFISEPLLPHCPPCKQGIHFVSAPIERLTEIILHYLSHEDQRTQITEQAYRLFTTQLTFRNSVSAMMGAVVKLRQPASALVAEADNEEALASAMSG